MEQSNSIKKHLVCLCDGAAVPNRGFGGSGLLGYTYSYSNKSKNVKHPIHPSLYFTPVGIQTEKTEDLIEVHEIIEVIKSINNSLASNNEAELLAVLTAFEKAVQLDPIESLTIYTDSNYIVSSYNENLDKWIKSGWKRLDGKLIVHLLEWEKILNYRELLLSKNVIINIKWIKGHSGIYGNEIADVYSTIGSIYSRNQIQNNTQFNDTLLDSVIDYKTYKKSYTEKDFIYFFRDLYFGTNITDDTNFCFLNTSEDPNMVGKKDTFSIFVTNIGYVPEVINKLKDIFRKEKRDYNTTGCIKLSKMENKDLFRIAHIVGIENAITKVVTNKGIHYCIAGDNTPFIFENTVGYPFIIKATSIFKNTLDIANKNTFNRLIEKDITDRIVKEGKLVFTNKDKNLDFSDVIENDVKLKQKLFVTVGYDIPSYLVLKKIEEEIRSVNLILECKSGSNFCTMYIKIVTDSREIYSVNIDNKFLSIN